MISTLYVIGNGFDLHHGIRSTYRDFGRFLDSRDTEIHGLLSKYFSADDEFWSDFEAQLADLDVDFLVDNASSFLASYGADDWSDSCHHDYQYEIERVVVGLSEGLRCRFAEWIRGLRIPDPRTIPSKLLRLKLCATFLNFNYTPSLTTLYGIRPTQVCHIHGSSAAGDSDLILGHAWNPAQKGSTNEEFDLEAADPRVLAGNEIIDEYFERTFKPTGSIIAAHRSFFASLSTVREIIVVGHSLSDVDLPYFQEIVRHIDCQKVSWRIRYHDRDALVRLRPRVERLGLAANVVEFLPIAAM